MKFKYKNDEITVNIRSWLLWKFWRAQTPEKCYHSKLFEYSFDSFREYWQEVGKRSALVQFISSRTPGRHGPKYYTADEIIQRIARFDLGENSGVVLTEIGYATTPRLMNMFPGVSQNVFKTGEFVVFPTQNKEAAIKLAHSIPSNLAYVVAFADGYRYGDNNNVE